MTAPVHLNDLLDELNMLRENATCYLNHHTGEIYTVSAEDASLLDLIDDPDVVSEDEREDLEKVFEVTHSSDFMALPGRSDFDQAMTVDAFCEYVGDNKQSKALREALDGGALEEALRKTELTQEWYAFKDETLARIARAWLEQRKIPYTEND